MDSFKNIFLPANLITYDVKYFKLNANANASNPSWLVGKCNYTVLRRTERLSWEAHKHRGVLEAPNLVLASNSSLLSS